MTHPRRQVYIKFALLLALLFSYFFWLSWQYDLTTGGIAAALTWSFFVLCTPVADAGFLLDFPLRMLFGIRMVISEIAVWAVAILINVLTITFGPQYYTTTPLTDLMHKILLTPWPFWGIIVLSGFGTFLSIRFGDELLDVLHHRDRAFFHSNHFRHELILFAFFILALFAYYQLIAAVGVAEIIAH